MIQFETKIRVLYGDTDKMGVVYYGHYPRYYETGRTELMRHIGFSYSSMEESGIMMPVVKMELEYIRSAFYDDLITVVTKLEELPKARIRFCYEIFNEKSELLNRGYTDLGFLRMPEGKPCRPPKEFLEKLENLFNLKNK